MVDVDMRIGAGAGTAVLVEGESDRDAIEALAPRLGRSLHDEGIAVVAMGGATNIGRFVRALGPAGRDLELAGLYDRAEERFVRRGLERAGLAAGASRDDLAANGFFVCEPDLEDEMIRALGVPRVLELVVAEGELASFQILQNQPAHRGRRVHDQLHRFIGTRAGRKIRYGHLLAEAVELDRIPVPLVRLFGHL